MLCNMSIREDDEDREIDFQNAGLYLCGFQIVSAVAVCATVSVASCWLLPIGAVSAVRTLVLTSLAAVGLVRRPVRVGRVRGVTLMFQSLRPCVCLYIASLVLEQLVHTCTRDDAAPPPVWRKVCFQLMVICMLVSGMIRARHPLSDTDLPFLITLAALLAIAILPPPAVALTGPLCEPASLSTAAERVVRAIAFALVYAVFVYSSAPSTSASSDICVCVSRAAAASLWCLGCSPLFLVMGVPQCALVIFVRMNLPPGGEAYASVPMADAEAPLHESSDDDAAAFGGAFIGSPAPPAPPVPAEHAAIGPRAFVDIGGSVARAPINGRGGASGHLSASRLAEIAARIDARSE